MFTPNTPKDDQEEFLPEWHEPFPEPNPFPSGWNMSSILPLPEHVMGLDADEESEN